MKGLVYSAVLITTCALVTSGVYAEGEDMSNGEEGAKVNIVLTRFDVNDTRLEAGWKIRNDTDHEVWICDRVIPPDSSGTESVAGADGKTHLLRRRLDLQQTDGWEHLPRGYYLRLRPGEERTNLYSLSIPIPYSLAMFGPRYAHGTHAERLVIEIGYYDEDLPALILSIADFAEQLACDVTRSSPLFGPDPTGFRARFFAGLVIARGYNLDSWAYFRNSVTSGADEIIVPYMWQALNGEKVLRIEIDPVSIPYEGGAWPPEGK